MQLGFNLSDESEVAIRNATANGNYTAFSRFSEDELKDVVKHKLNEQQRNELVLQSIEKGILTEKSFIDLCRQSKLYGDILSAFVSVRSNHGYYDPGRIEKIYRRFHSKEFENLAERKGTLGEAEEEKGIIAKLIAYVALRDFQRCFENPEAVGVDTSFGKFLTGEFSPKIKHWYDRISFWGTITWRTSYTALSTAALSALAFFVALPVVSLTAYAACIATALAGLSAVIIHYIDRYVFRKDDDVWYDYRRNDRLAENLDKTEKIYAKATENENLSPVAVDIAKLENPDAQIDGPEALENREIAKPKFKGDYSKKHICKVLSGRLKIAAILSGVVCAIASSLLIAPIAGFLITGALPFIGVLSVAAASGAVFVGSILGLIISKVKYNSIKGSDDFKNAPIRKPDEENNKIKLSDVLKQEIEKAKRPLEEPNVVEIRENA